MAILYWPGNNKEAYILGFGKSISAFTDGWVIMLQTSMINPLNEKPDAVPTDPAELETFRPYTMETARNLPDCIYGFGFYYMIGILLLIIAMPNYPKSGGDSWFDLRDKVKDQQNPDD